MKRLVAGLAFMASVAAFLVIVGGGLVLLVIPNSGERLAGAVLVLAGAIAFAAAMALVFARPGAFARPGGGAGALTAALLGVLPPAALSAIAVRFTGFPASNAVPLIDWGIFLGGVFFALGGLAVLARGYWRLSERASARARPEAVQPLARQRHKETPLDDEASLTRPLGVPPERSGAVTAFRLLPDEPSDEPNQPATRRASAILDDDDEVRVTPVELPSIGQFRRR